MTRKPKVHPAASVFPALPEEELRELAEDIRRHGLLLPIELLDGKVIDGRNRLEACQIVAVDPDFVEITLTDQTPEEYVWSLNGTRRHLTASQRAAIALEMVPHYAEQAKERLKTSTGGANPQPRTLVPQAGKHGENGPKGRAVDHAAKVAGVSPTMVKRAGKVKEADPALHEEIKTGAKTVGQAERELKARDKPQGKPAKEPSHAALVDASRKLVGPLVRSIDGIAKALGGEGANHARAMAGLDEVIAALKSMRKGEK